jgi:hypothetical protein
MTITDKLIEDIKHAAKMRRQGDPEPVELGTDIDTYEQFVREMGAKVEIDEHGEYVLCHTERGEVKLRPSSAGSPDVVRAITGRQS